MHACMHVRVHAYLRAHWQNKWSVVSTEKSVEKQMHNEYRLQLHTPHQIIVFANNTEAASYALACKKYVYI